MKFCTTVVNPGMNLLRNTLITVLQGSKISNSNNSMVIGSVNNMRTYLEFYFIFLLCDVVILNNNCDCCSAFNSFSIVYFPLCTSDSQIFWYIFNLLRNTLVTVLQGFKFLY